MKKILTLLFTLLAMPLMAQNIMDTFNKKVEEYSKNTKLAENKAKECRAWEKKMTQKEKEVKNALGYTDPNKLDKQIVNKFLDCRAADKALTQKLEEKSKLIENKYKNDKNKLTAKINECKKWEESLAKNEKSMLMEALWEQKVHSLPDKYRDTFIECMVVEHLNRPY